MFRTLNQEIFITVRVESDPDCLGAGSDGSQPRGECCCLFTSGYLVSGVTVQTADALLTGGPVEGWGLVRAQW